MLGKGKSPDTISGLFYTNHYTNARGILENLLFGGIVGFEGFVHRVRSVLSSKRFFQNWYIWVDWEYG
jgi:hypothetical protein